MTYNASTGAPSFFYKKSTGGCLSGCVDLLVTVKDDITHQPPPAGSTRIVAYVTPIDNPKGNRIAPYPSTLNAGTGHLCVLVSATITCGDGSGTSVVTPLVDPDGQVELRYWAPGLYSVNGNLQPSKVTLHIKAVESCVAACPLHQKTGRRVPTFSVYPRLVYRGKFVEVHGVSQESRRVPA